jgi:hypothetical protein
MERCAPTVSNDPVLTVVAQAWANGFTTRSDYARSHAEAVAVAACRGLITTKDPTTGEYQRKWRVTPKGATYLFEE